MTQTMVGSPIYMAP